MTESKYTVLFGGGAIRGMAYVGALRALEELGIEFDIVGGSSVGSIFATLVACGYKSYELENMFMKVNFELFKDIHFGFGKAFGLSKGEVFTDWLNSLISKKIKSRNGGSTKFEDLEKELVIITTNLTKFKPQEFSNKLTPNFEIANAIRISSSMPGLMPPYRYKGDDLVDGDLQKASPMWKLSDTINNSESRILEFRLEGDCKHDVKNPISFVNTIYSCVTEVATEFVEEIYGLNDRYDCIKINTGDIFFADLNLNKESRQKLIEIGYKQTMDYFKKALPHKKEALDKAYTKIYKSMKKAFMGLKSNNVEEVQWWFGDLFTSLCEDKEIIDETIYNQIVDLKNNLQDSVGTILFFHTHFKNKGQLEQQMKCVLEILDERIAEIRLFISSGESKFLK